jgi:predicted nucleic acid-binding protein
MVNKVILDSNIWIGYFNDKDSLHKQTLKIVDSASIVYVPEYVLLESVSILKMKATPTLANFCLDVFLHTHNIHIIPSGDLFKKTITLFQTLNDKHLSFVDLSLLALSRDYEVKTFDKKLAATIKKFNK